MARLEGILRMRARVAERYTERLQRSDGLVLPGLELAGGRLSWFVYVVRLHQRFGEAVRDEIVERLMKEGIACARYFGPIHRQPAYSGVEVRNPLPVTEAVSQRTIALPFFNRITEEQIDLVCDALERAVGQADRYSAGGH